MKIFRIAQNQMIQSVPGGSSLQNASIQVNNLNQALPILTRLRGIIQMADDLHAKAAELGNEIGNPGLADQVLKSVQTIIAENPEFASLVQIGVVGSIQELFNTGVLEQKITFTTRQLQSAQAAQSESNQTNQGNQSSISMQSVSMQ